MEYKETEEIESTIIKEISKYNDIRLYKFRNSVENITTEKIEITNCIFENCKCTDSKFINVYFTNTIFKDCDFSNTDFSESNFVKCIFLNCKFIGAKFVDTSIYKMNIKQSNLEYSNLSNSNIKETNFEETNLAMSSFEECKLKNVINIKKTTSLSLFLKKLGVKEYNYNSKTHSIDFICGKCYCNFHNDDDAEYEDIWWTIKMNDKNQHTPDTVVNFDLITDWQIW